MSKMFAIAAAALVLGSVGVAHADSDTVSVRVPYGDLDLTGGAGRAVLQNRIAHAINVLCGDRPSPPNDLGQLDSYRVCRRTAFASADRQLAMIGAMKMANAGAPVQSGEH